MNQEEMGKGLRMRGKLSRSITVMVIAAGIAVSTGAHARTLQIVALGDSNTAGFLVGKRNAFPAIIEASLRAAGYDVAVSNQGISGDTTSGMLARLSLGS
jgi:acyl-CoA thioesterase I